MNFVDKWRSTRKETKNEHAEVNQNPVAHTVIQCIVFVVDLAIMAVLLWNAFAYFIPYGSWVSIVDGESMYPTMHDRQLLFSDSKIVSRGDVVTTKPPQFAIDQNAKYADMIFVKRVIGLPGDTISINETGVYVNNVRVDEYYLTDAAKATTYEASLCNDIVLKGDEYYIMGDNRNASYDSRYFGPVRGDDIFYTQSLTPTTNFWAKLLFVILIFALDVALYSLVEYVLTALIYAIFFKKKETVIKDGNKTTLNITSETIILKGDNE